MIRPLTASRFFFALLSFALIGTSCATSDKKLSLTSLGPVEAAGEMLDQIESPRFNSTTCSADLSAFTREIDAIDYEKLPREELPKIATRLSDQWSKIRRALHRKPRADFPLCESDLKKAFRQLRLAEDYVYEIAKPASQKIEVKPGDLLLIRETDFFSSALTRLWDVSELFSRISLVADDPESLESPVPLKTLDARSENGIEFSALPSELTSAGPAENIRVLVLRPKDGALGARSAERFAKLIREKKNQGEKPAADGPLGDVAFVAYQMGSDGAVRLSRFANEIEIDPRFEIRGELRDASLLRSSRQKDAVLSQLYTWMNDLHYAVIGSKKNTLSEVAEKLLDHLRSGDLARESAGQLPLPYAALVARLDALRESDHALYQNPQTRRKSLFHGNFRPKKGARPKAKPSERDPGTLKDYPAMETDSES